MNDPRASGSACGVRSPVRYGRNVSPSVPAGHASAAAVKSSYPTPGAIVLRSHCSDPAADSITPIACQAPGTAWQNACTRPSGSAANRSRAANTTPDVPSATDTRPRSVDTDPDRARRLVARAGGDRHALGRLTRHRRALEHRRQPRRIELQSAQHLFAPGASRDVEQQRPGGVGDVGRVLAAQAQAHVVLGKRDPRDLREDLGSWRRSHSSFGAVKPGSARLPVSDSSRSSPIVSSISAHSAAVRWSFHRIAGRSTRSSASSATSPCICPDNPIPANGPAAPRSSARHRLGRLPPVGRVLLGPARRAASTADSRTRRGRGSPPRGRSPGP